MKNSSPVVAVIVLNWNGWADTIECLESLFRSRYHRFHVLVCDNGSKDDSLEKIRAWADGRLDLCLPAKSALRSYCLPPVSKPIAYSGYSRAEAERSAGMSSPLLLIDTGSNLGYAGGNNVGLRCCLANPDVDYVWILNNDTVVHPDAMSELVQVLAKDVYQRPAGSRLYDYDHPERLQTWGGQTLGRLGVIAPRYTSRIESVRYLMGASLFISRERLWALGLLNETYFLNAEDLEYTVAYGRCFSREHPGVSPFLVAGTVWHKESAAQSRNSYLHAYYFTRNVLHAAARLGTWSRWATLLYTILRMVKTAAVGRWDYLQGMYKGLCHYLRGITGPYPGAD